MDQFSVSFHVLLFLSIFVLVKELSFSMMMTQREKGDGNGMEV
jgi:hypothetical protein